MKPIQIEQAVTATKGSLLQGNPKATISGVSHDSRNATDEHLFFAIVGERFDGHDFIRDVVKAGCRNIVVSHRKWMDQTDTEGIQVILVEDTVKALQNMASWYLKTFAVTTIGVTGSTGKTSTKDMMYAVCSTKYKTGSTKGNFNNDIGMPLTVLGLPDDTEVAVLEMGMDHFGEIHRLVDIARPTIGLITNIGISHMENLGSRKGIMKAKMEITDYFGKDNTLVISTGEDLLRKENIHGIYQLVTTGSEPDNDYVIGDIKEKPLQGLDFTLTHCGKFQCFHLPIAGRHNAFNAALAVAAGEKLGISMAQAAEGLAAMELTKGRLTVKKNKDVMIIDDTYNASPDSVKAAVDVLSGVEGKRKIAILGDMYELGDDTDHWHRQVGEYVAASAVDTVYAIGEHAKYIAMGAGEKGEYFAEKEAFLQGLKDRIGNDACVLVKGSRGMAMETIVEELLVLESE